MIPAPGGDENKVVAQVELSVSQQSVHGRQVLAVGGEIDVSSAPTLQDGLVALVQSGERTPIVDLSEVDFLDSTGLGALVAARSAATDLGSRLMLVCGRERILKLFRITGLDSAFEIHPTLQAALDAAADPAV